MQDQTEQAFSRNAKWLKLYLHRHRWTLLTAFIAVFLMGGVAHGYCFANLTLSHDSLHEFYLDSELINWKVSLGRFAEPLYQLICRGRFAMPWFSGFLSLLWIFFASFFVVRLFDIRNPLIIILVCGILTVNPTVYSLAATYISDLDAVMFAVMLASLAALLWRRSGKCLFLIVPCLVLVLGIYQCILSVYIVLIIIGSIEDLLYGKKTKDVLIHGGTSIGLILISGVLYLLLVKLTCYLRGVSLTDGYNGLMNLFTAPKNIGMLLLKTYLYCESSIVYSVRNDRVLSFALHCLLVTPVLYAGIKIICSKKIKIWSKVLLAVLVALLPFAMNLTCFLDEGFEHDLMEYAFYLVYPLYIVVAVWCCKQELPNRDKRLVVSVMAFSLAVLIAFYSQNANVIYVYKNMNRQATLSVMSEVADDMEKTEGYVPGVTKVAFIGTPQVTVPNHFGKYETMGALYDVITYYGTYEDYFEYVLQKPLILYSVNETKYYAEIGNLPDDVGKPVSVYPQEGYIQWVDDVLVVYMSE